MSYEFKIKFKDDLNYSDISSLVTNDYTLTQGYYNSEFKHIRNSIKFTIKLDSILLGKFLNNVDFIDLQVKKDGADIFTGVINPGVKSGLNNSPISLEIEGLDYTEILDSPLSETVILTNGKLFDSNNPSNSMIHILMSKITKKTINCFIGVCSFSVPYLVFKQDEKISDILENCLYEYGFQYSFNSSGTLEVHSWNDDILTTSATVGDNQTLIDGTFDISQKYNSSDESLGGADSVTSTFTPVEILTDFNVFNQVQLTPGALTAGTWYEGNWNLVFQRLPSDELLNLIPKKIKFTVNGKSDWWATPNKITIDLNSIQPYYIVENSLQPITGGTRLARFKVEVQIIQNSKTSFTVRARMINEAGFTTINYWSISTGIVLADVAVKRPPVSLTPSELPAKGLKGITTEAKNSYIYTKEFAQTFASLYQKNILGNNLIYTFKSYNSYNPGDNLQITFTEKGFETKAKILKKDYEHNSKIYSYELKGISSVNVTPGTSYPETFPQSPGLVTVDNEGNITGSINGNKLEENLLPSETGLWFTKDNFGYYDAVNGKWTTRISSDGKGYFSGLIEAGEGIQSSNFLTGVSGFRISGDGDIEANDIILRGALISTSEQFTPVNPQDVLDLNFLTLNSSTNGGVSKWIKSDSTGKAKIDFLEVNSFKKINNSISISTNNSSYKFWHSDNPNTLNYDTHFITYSATGCEIVFYLENQTNPDREATLYFYSSDANSRIISLKCQDATQTRNFKSISDTSNTRGSILITVPGIGPNSSKPFFVKVKVKAQKLGTNEPEVLIESIDSFSRLPRNIENSEYGNNYNLGSLTGTVSINWQDSDLFYGSLTGNTTLTFSNPRKTTIRLIVTHSASQFTLTFPTCYSIGTTGTSAKVYTLTGGNTKKSIYDIFYDGTNYYVSEGKFYA